MIIDIHQKKLSIGDKYKISVNEVLKYLASRELIQLLPKILVKDAENNTLKIKINKRLQWFKAKYEIALVEGDVYLFKTISYFRLHYQCLTNNGTYDIYGHRGRKYSVYKDNQQIAWWEKDMITWLEGDTYRITANKDSNEELLIAFCLIMDNYSSGNKGEDVLTINWGYMGLQSKRFDKDWTPAVL